MEDKIVRAGDDSALIRGKLKVEWRNIGEGNSGDFNEEDPNDTNYLRFYICEKKGREWEDVEDGSYCTLFPAEATEDQKIQALRLIMDQVYGDWEAGNVKHTAERLSWIEP